MPYTIESSGRETEAMPPVAAVAQAGALPNLIIAGVHKAGTTSLYSYLARHPRICPSYTKEIGYFYPLLYGRELAPADEYARHFRHWDGEPYRLEASPSYLYGGETIANAVSRLAPDARIVVILRDPTDRLLSYFSRAVADSELPDGTTFEEFVRASVEQQGSAERSVRARGFREGIYVDYLRPWANVFGANLKIAFFDELRSRPGELVVGITRWLGLDPAEAGSAGFDAENRTVQYRHKRLHRYVKKIYMKNEAFWRRNQALKVRLRQLYNLLNAERRKAPADIGEDVIARVRELYAPHNRRLRDFLEQRGLSSLPGWLA